MTEDERQQIAEEMIRKSEESMRAYLRAKSWPEKIRSIERMRAADRSAKAGMKETLARRAAEEKKTDG